MHRTIYNRLLALPTVSTSPLTFWVSPNKKHVASHTVDGRNPAPVDMVNFLLFTGFYTSKRWLALGFLNHQPTVFFFFSAKQVGGVGLQCWRLQLSVSSSSGDNACMEDLLPFERVTWRQFSQTTFFWRIRNESANPEMMERNFWCEWFHQNELSIHIGKKTLIQKVEVTQVNKPCFFQALQYLKSKHKLNSINIQQDVAPLWIYIYTIKKITLRSRFLIDVLYLQGLEDSSLVA